MALREWRYRGYSTDNGQEHASKGDARYPSPRRVRIVLAFFVDVLVHFLCAAGLTMAVYAVPHRPDWALLVALFGGYLLVSLIHRVFIQGATHATLGKAMFGLCVIRPDTGAPPGKGRLALHWILPSRIVAELLAAIPG